jgi:hypothetical protein
VVEIPEGFQLPPDGPSVLILCRWHRAADTRRARDIDALTAGLKAVQDRCDEMLAENRLILGGCNDE